MSNSHKRSGRFDNTIQKLQRATVGVFFVPKFNPPKRVENVV